jgi:hypothetical protein
MKRTTLETELKAVGVSLNGWMPVFQCDNCKHRWEVFQVAVGPNFPTVRLDYWKCPKGCNAKAQVSRPIQTAIPKYVEINDIPGMIFDDEELPEFERWVRSMDMTEITNKSL